MQNAGTLGARQLSEASGLAASGRRANLLWAVNDSGNTPFLYALDTEGHDLGSVSVVGAQNRDWEDLASFQLDGKPYLLIADTGDNTASHKRYRLYVVEEPESGNAGKVSLAWTIPFVYPDGPRDSESVAVDSGSERVLLLSKRESPPRVFAVPLRAPPDGAPVRAESLTNVDLHARSPAATGLWASLYDRPTAWDFSPNWIAVLTYTRVVLYPRKAGEPLLDALARAPVALEVRGLSQAEALALRGDSLYVTGEGGAAALLSSHCACDGCAAQ